MARTTGYSATMAIRLIASGLYKDVGISPPERIGQNEDCAQFILNGLKERGIVIDLEIQES
jgi:lysine 6-dehydrogenase